MPYVRSSYKKTSSSRSRYYRSRSRKTAYKPRSKYIPKSSSSRYVPKSTSQRRYRANPVVKPAPAPVPVEDKFDRNVRRANEVISIAGRFMPIDLKKDTTIIAQGLGKAIGNVKLDVSKAFNKIFKL